MRGGDEVLSKGFVHVVLHLAQARAEHIARLRQQELREAIDQQLLVLACLDRGLEQFDQLLAQRQRGVGDALLALEEQLELFGRHVVAATVAASTQLTHLDYYHSARLNTFRRKFNFSCGKMFTTTTTTTTDLDSWQKLKIKIQSKVTLGGK